MSPTIFRYHAYRFFFFSNEGNPIKPLHIHVRRDELLAKFWLLPEIKLAENYGFSSKELKKIKNIISYNESEIRNAWNKYFNE